MMATDLSIVIPLFNEEGNVELLYEQLCNALDPLGRTYEIAASCRAVVPTCERYPSRAVPDGFRRP
jgi:hypothetical protein